MELVRCFGVVSVLLGWFGGYVALHLLWWWFEVESCYGVSMVVV